MSEADDSSPLRRVLAHYDDSGVRLYQAFEPRTVHIAVEQGTFGVGFGLDRITWVKPSFGWMLHRSAYATRSRQEAIARITVTHTGFQTILEQSIPTAYDPTLFASETEWRRLLDASDVCHQWDPDRSLDGRPLARRAIQIGVRGTAIRRYVHEWIVHVEDATELARAIAAAVRADQPLPAVPLEREYLVAPDIARRLGIG